jgi:hypothetical protein
MIMTSLSMKKEFEKWLETLDFSFKCYNCNFYSLFQNKEVSRNIIVQLVTSEPIDEIIHGSHNNNEIQAIGYFKFTFMIEVKEPDFYIMAFQNKRKSGVEFIIIRKLEFMKRLFLENRISPNNQEIALVFWYMPDNYLYEATDIGIQGEWYYMSKGLRGRMADKTILDYSEFLNDWNRLIMI